MSSLVPRPFSLSFHLGKIPVVIQPTFWLMAILMGFGLPNHHLVIWVAVVLVSILVHELGHALAYRAFGAGSGIELYAFGGLCYGDRDVGRWPGIIVSLAGPGAGFVLGGLAWVVSRSWDAPPEPAYVALWQLMWVNFFWGLMNLLPVLPLDGGRVMEGVMGPRRQARIPLIAAVVGTGVALAAAQLGHLYMAVLFGFLAFRNWQAWSQSRPRAPKPQPQAPAEQNVARIHTGWEALHAGNEREAGRLGKLVLGETGRPGEKAAALDLLCWSALAEGEATQALAWLRQIKPPELARPLSWALAWDAANKQAEALPHALAAVAAEPSDTSAGLAVKLLVALGEHARAGQLAFEFAWRSEAAAQSARAQLVVPKSA